MKEKKPKWMKDRLEMEEAKKEEEDKKKRDQDAKDKELADKLKEQEDKRIADEEKTKWERAAAERRMEAMIDESEDDDPERWRRVEGYM